MAFAENLRQIRKEQGISQESLAELLGVSRQAVSKWEQGLGYPEVEKLILLSQTLHVSLDALMSAERKNPGDSAESAVVKSGKIRVLSFDGRSIVHCSKIQSSHMFKAKADEPKYALFGTDGQSLWGENAVLLGWYADEESLKKETQCIMEALNRGEEAYELKYAVKVKKHWWKVKMDDSAQGGKGK